MSGRDLQLPMREIVQICRRHRVRELAVFGSVGTDRFRDDSDIDLLVEFAPGAAVGLIEFLQLQDELSAALKRPVDLVSKRGLKPLIRERVLADAEVLFATEELYLRDITEVPHHWRGGEPNARRGSATLAAGALATDHRLSKHRLHAYFTVDWEIVWQTATRDVPTLRSQVALIIEQELGPPAAQN